MLLLIWFCINLHGFYLINSTIVLEFYEKGKFMRVVKCQKVNKNKCFQQAYDCLTMKDQSANCICKNIAK